MVELLITGLLVVVSLVNLAPAIGLLSPERMSALYGIAIDEPNLVILMQHRALLFGLVGGVILVSAFYLPLRSVAVVLGFISMLGFVVIAGKVGGYNRLLRKVVIIDVVASVLLALALLLDFAQ